MSDTVGKCATRFQISSTLFKAYFQSQNWTARSRKTRAYEPCTKALPLGQSQEIVHKHAFPITL